MESCPTTNTQIRGSGTIAARGDMGSAGAASLEVPSTFRLFSSKMSFAKPLVTGLIPHRSLGPEVVVRARLSCFASSRFRTSR